MAYNTSIQPTTGLLLFYLMFGQQAHIPVDVMYGSPVVEAHLILMPRNLKNH